MLSIIIDILLSLSSSLISAIPKNELVIFLEPQVSFHHWSVGEWTNLWLVTANNDDNADRKSIKRVKSCSQMNYTYHNLPTVWVVDIDQGCPRAVKSQLSDVGVWSMVGELKMII